MATIPYGDVHLAGVATDSYNTIVLVTGDTPPAVTSSEIAAVKLAQWQVVGRDVDGKLVPAVLGTTEAIGFTVNEVDPAVGSGKVAAVRAGTYNPNALVWDASYDTDAKKKTAFEKTGTQIFMVEPLYNN